MIAKEQRSTQAGTRRIRWIGGTRRTKQEAKPCGNGWHAGPFVARPDITTWMRESFARVDFHAPLEHYGDCLACGSTIARSQLKRPA